MTFIGISQRVKPDEPLSKEDTKTIADEMNRLKKDFEHLNLTFSLKCLNDLIQKMEFQSITFTQFGVELDALSNRIYDELESITFGFIPKEKTEYFENNELFGKDVFEAFPTAREEIKEASNCFAQNLNTACVFHLMRSAEIAVKEMYKLMASRKSLVYGKDKSGKLLSKPIELCDWRTLITGLTLALDRLEQGKSKSLAKQKTHSFYSEVILLFKNLKDGWRNTISHGHEVNHDNERKIFKAGETEDIMRDTKRFMQRIAMKIKVENNEK